MKIGFKPCYLAAIVGSNKVFLLSEKDPILLKGKLFVLAAPFLEKPNFSKEEVISFLKEKCSLVEACYVLEYLEKQEYIEEIESCLPNEAQAFCNLMGISGHKAVEFLKSFKVFIKSTSSLDPTPLKDQLEGSGISLVESSLEADLSVLVVKDYLQNEVEIFNKEAQKRKHPWLLIKPVGSTVWIGPFFKPDKTGCWECLAFRLRNNRVEEAYIQYQNEMKKDLFVSIAILPSTFQMGLAFAATEIIKYVLQGKESALLGKIRSIHTIEGTAEEHILTKRPQCACCGSPHQCAENYTRPLLLKRLKKGSFNDGGWRSIRPEETFERLSCHISPVTGIVSALRRLEIGNGRNFFVYGAGVNAAVLNRCNGNALNLLREKCTGKGKGEAQAKVGALCESIERYAGLFEGIEKRKKGTYKYLSKEAIHPAQCLLYSLDQYASREKLNPTSHSFHKVFDPFSEDEEIEWSPVWSLKEKKHKFLPTAYCYYGYSPAPFCRADSNGTASGNSYEEAILHALFELIERDSVAIWWYNRLERPLVDLKNFDDPLFDAIVLDYEGIGRKLWVLDITSDLGIPTFAAISRKIEGPFEEIIMGFGCDLDVQVAISKALVEMNQGLSFDGQDKNNLEEDQEATELNILLEWWKTATVSNQSYLKGSSKTAFDYKRLHCSDFLEEIELCQKILSDAGMELYVLDLTRPDIDLKVVKAIVPGLRHFWPRFAPGRLYDVPVKMGWLKAPLKESELNPIGIFF